MLSPEATGLHVPLPQPLLDKVESQQVNLSSHALS
jgi:hypothetical protein